MLKRLKEQTLEQVRAAVQARDESAMPRAMCGLEPPTVRVCLGPGRCMFSKEPGEVLVCPFCRHYPPGHSSEREIRAWVDQFERGN